MSQRRSRRRIIEGVRLEAGGLLPGETRVEDWPGGELRIVVRRPDIQLGVPIPELPIEEVEFGRGDYVPFGHGFALPASLSVEHVEEMPGIEFEIGVRDGRPRCVAIRSLEGGEPITTTLLRSGRLPAIPRVVRESVAQNAVRVVRSSEGETIGIHSLSTSELRDTFEERSADVDSAVDELERRERRWRLTDEHLAEVAAVYREALNEGRPTGKAVARKFETSEENARRWVARARTRGQETGDVDRFLPETEPRKARG